MEEKQTGARASRLKEFLAQLESPEPIVLEDAYDVAELTWMCDRLRTSERYGGDNRLYLRYSSPEALDRAQAAEDWSAVTASGKAVIVRNAEDERRARAEHFEKHAPAKLAIDEIVEIADSIPRGFSGSDFFNMILDSHPYLLTTGWQGLGSFPGLYTFFFKGKTAAEAVHHLRHPKDDREEKLRDYNLDCMLQYKTIERKYPFYDKLTEYLDPQKVYGITDWFRAFFLAVNDVVGRTFPQRIAPAIFFDEHGGREGYVQRFARETFGFQGEQHDALMAELLDGFRYRRFVGIVRAPLSRLGCGQNFAIKSGATPGTWLKDPFATLRWFTSGEPYGYYIAEDDPRWAVSRQVRFEDLKLYPKETTEQLCAFLRIPWSESCLHLTTNGDDGGIVDGTAGFDAAPVYKLHEEHLSALDKYRIELLNAESFRVWDYDLKYYDGQRYTKEELKKLFDLPFKVETQTLEGWPGWPDAAVVQKFHEWIYERALAVMEHGETVPPLDDAGRPKRLVQALYPELLPGQRRYTNGTFPAGASVTFGAAYHVPEEPQWKKWKSRLGQSNLPGIGVLKGVWHWMRRTKYAWEMRKAR